LVGKLRNLLQLLYKLCADTIRGHRISARNKFPVNSDAAHLLANGRDHLCAFVREGRLDLDRKLSALHGLDQGLFGVGPRCDFVALIRKPGGAWRVFGGEEGERAVAECRCQVSGRR
jgi:hypothetical protein